MTSRPEVCVGAVVVNAGRILLIRRGQPPQAGCWSVPGGRVERGESLTEAVVREVEEETGLIVSVGSFLGWAERLTEAHHYVILDFAAAPIGGLGSVDATLRAGDDASEAAWVLIEDLDRSALVDGLRTCLREVGVA